MMNDFGQLNVNAYKPKNLYGIYQINLYAHEETTADLVILPPGASIPPHRHENAHEVFDVLDGAGRFHHIRPAGFR